MKRQDVIVFIAKQFKMKDIPTDANMQVTREWDSLSQVSLMLALEKEIGQEIPPDLFGELTSVEAITGFLAEEGLLEE